LYYLLLTDSGDLECYEEAMHVDTKNKWEQGMKEDLGLGSISYVKKSIAE
jgi:hypothetical protein